MGTRPTFSAAAKHREVQHQDYEMAFFFILFAEIRQNDGKILVNYDVF